MLPSVLAKQLETGIGDYIETSFPMTNEPFRGSVEKMLADGDAVYHDPYVSLQLPFRVSEEMPTCFQALHPAFVPYVHQQAAFDRLTGNDGRSTLIATGTGSGKTECFLYPILEYCYQHRGERGIKALIIYPMNALALDQAQRIAKLIWDSPELRGNVTAGMYVGGHEKNASCVMSEKSILTDHETILGNPPDILLTNYKMLDYLLVRPKDAALWAHNVPETLKYIAVDELHTFDGAQGTDLACLLRRLKSRLWTPGGYLCCIGTSATMGSKENGEQIREYAKEIFDEPFDEDAIITEDRLSPAEFFAGCGITDFTVPAAQQVEQLNALMEQDDEAAYLRSAAEAWTDMDAADIMTPTGRLKLGRHLMHHSAAQTLISLAGAHYHQVKHLVEELQDRYPALQESGDAEAAVNALLALISHARTGDENSLRPFLNMHVQLWIRELRRLLGTVSRDTVTYAIARDLNSKQAEQYLPVVNCPDCGATGWASVVHEKNVAALGSLETFYNLFFRGDQKITMMFPHEHAHTPDGTVPGYICPNCLQVKDGHSASSMCDRCESEMVEIVRTTQNETTGRGHNKHYVCPICGSKRGLTLMGVRSATEIGAELSQLFASRFNDDKKTLAFSDSVQDAAHRAGFFNARTWRSGLRTAIQQFAQTEGSELSLAEFTDAFLAYWEAELDVEDFVSLFIAPNMIWMPGYENMVESRKLGNGQKAKDLLRDIERRLAYEIMLEYGVMSRAGRTLTKSGCSCLSFPSDAIVKAADAVHERAINELGVLTEVEKEAVQRMVAGYLRTMAHNGAFEDPVFDSFLKSRGRTYLLSNDHIPWMPGNQGDRNMPRFIYEPRIPGAKKLEGFDSFADRKYTDWIASCCGESLKDPSLYADLSLLILQELVRQESVVSIPIGADYTVYALDKNKVFVTDRVARMTCDVCGITESVAEDNVGFWADAPCIRRECSGTLEKKDGSGADYYGKLFSNGNLARINAVEHTGLLERDNRQNLEANFKRSREETKRWDPNVLSCTPTLEMGIDIGDLSTVILCSMPPSPSQFQQRTGRAGRRDGNALTLVVASARPHDLYYYSDPLEMLEGAIVPPKIFLKASAVLERQFVAYCMDSWVRSKASEKSIPKNVGGVLGKLEDRPADAFPFNFLRYVQNNLTSLLNMFMRLFDQNLDETTREELKRFARGEKDVGPASPLQLRILGAFEDLRQQVEALSGSIKELKALISELESKPKDSSYEDEIKELKSERVALANVIKEIRAKDIFNFLSDEGLLPNYAFPEAGIVLRAVMHRKENETEQPKQKRQRSVYEYMRSASSAISEFAPNNVFYAGGHRLMVDQVDLTIAQVARWRLCPNCSHAQLEEVGKNTASCPKCGSTAWADAGQIRNMLKVQMVYSNADYSKTLISDERDDRLSTFYCRQLLVDVDDDHDVGSAYEMDNEKFNFGYDFVKKATLRDINFGERDMFGEKLSVSGVEDVRKGFRICRSCGKIQPNSGEPVHTAYCKHRGKTASGKDPFQECLFLYREFSTEALRVLIPATTMDQSTVRTESFVAAFMLGMKEYFGNVDHLRATVSNVPVEGAQCRKQYLVIYDSVPGGTGYLKQLMNDQGSLVDILERALHKLEQCSCKDDPQKDGCYHCLYAYRQSQNIGNISRSAAIRMLRDVLSGKDNLTAVRSIVDISVNPLMDSELERQFVGALSQKANEDQQISISQSLVNGKQGYILRVNGSTWEIEPQVSLGPADGVSVPCKPDFVLRPVGKSEHRPVAVFTDGFTYHKDRVADDTLKREAVRRSGKYRVWALSWKDVASAFGTQADYATPTLAHERMPSGSNMYQPTVVAGGAEGIRPAELSTFELLMRYLSMPDAEQVFATQAQAYALSLLEPQKCANESDFVSWHDTIQEANEQVGLTEETFEYSGSFFGTWKPRSSEVHFGAYAGVRTDKLAREKTKALVPVLAILDDDADNRTDLYEQEWNGFWHFFNLMQFGQEFAAVSTTGLKEHIYEEFPGVLAASTEDSATAENGDEAWAGIREQIFGETMQVADQLEAEGIEAPDEVGYELTDENGAVIAELEFAWTERRIGYMAEYQLEGRDQAEKAGWKIFVSADPIGAIFMEGERING